MTRKNMWFGGKDFNLYMPCIIASMSPNPKGFQCDTNECTPFRYMNDLYRSIFIKSRKEQRAAKKFDMFGNDISGKSWTFTIFVAEIFIAEKFDFRRKYGNIQIRIWTA